jgi:hypothetical protein
MRLVRASARLVATALVACAMSGCFINEIDKSVENAKSPGQKAAEAAAKGPAASGDAAAPKQTASADKKPAAPQGAAWWQSAKSLGSEESTTDIVACKTKSGKTDFMARDDCLARGGVTQ